MAISSKIIFCKNIKLDRDNTNVLTYSESDMLTLVNSNGIKVAESTNYSFIGKGDRDAIDVQLDLSLTYQVLLQCNYIAFQNTNYSNKWYFAFIDRVQYINDGVARIHYTVDIFATWWSYWSPKACFVNREHVNDDTIGLHTLPENLELGEHIIQSGPPDVAGQIVEYTTPLHYIGLGDRYIVVAMTTWMPNYAVPPATRVYNGVYSGLKYYVFKDEDDVDAFIDDMQSEFDSDPIHSIFIVPAALCPLGSSDWFTPTGKSYELAWFPVSDRATKMGDSVLIGKPDHLDTSYVPVNKKLLTFPYCYLLVGNNSGMVKEYRYEFFNSVYATFDIYGAVIDGCSIRMYPTGYNMKHPSVTMQANNNYEAIDAPKLPTCAWTNDPYTNWLTQQSVNMPLNTIKNIGSIVGGIGLAAATGGTAALMGGGLALSGVTGIFDQMKQKYEHSLAPETAKGGANQGNLTFGMFDTFTVNRVSIREEYARSIDNYFSKFGYQINRTKLPNQTGRTTYNYVQIGTAEILAYQKTDVLSVPAQDLVNINKLYQRGITLWHSHSNLGDYSQSNNIVNPPTPPTTPITTPTQ